MCKLGSLDLGKPFKRTRMHSHPAKTFPLFHRASICRKSWPGLLRLLLYLFFLRQPVFLCFLDKFAHMANRRGSSAEETCVLGHFGTSFSKVPSLWRYDDCVVRARSCDVACITTGDYIVVTVAEYGMSKLMSPSPVCLGRNPTHRPYHHTHNLTKYCPGMHKLQNHTQSYLLTTCKLKYLPSPMFWVPFFLTPNLDWWPIKKFDIFSWFIPGQNANQNCSGANNCIFSQSMGTKCTLFPTYCVYGGQTH